MTEKEIIEKVERVAFENGLFIVDFDFSFPAHFEKLFKSVNKFLDLFVVTLIVPSIEKGKFIHVSLEESPDESREDFFLTRDKEINFDAKPKLYAVLYFDFTDIPEKKRVFFPILRKCEKKFGPLDVRHYVHEELSDYLEIVFEITDFSIDYFYTDLL